MADRLATIRVQAQLANGVLVRPGDKLIVAVPRRPTMAELDAWRERLEAALPGVEVLLVKASQLAVYRPGDGADG